MSDSPGPWDIIDNSYAKKKIQDEQLRHDPGSDMASEDSPKAQKASKSKGKDPSKKSSKKRRHEEQQAAEQQAPIDLSPSKRQRTDDESGIISSSRSAADAQPEDKTAGGLYTPSDAELEQQSPFFQQTTSFYLPLAPVAHRFPLQGLCAEHISPLLLTYYPPLKGVLLSYSNPRLSSSPHNVPSASSASRAPAGEPLAMAKSIDEYAASFVWLTADFTVLRPVPGACIQGHVSLQNESYLGLVCWNFFNAGIDRKRLPKDWQWVGDSTSTTAARREGSSADWMRRGKPTADSEQGGYFVDGQGNKVTGMLSFRVKDYESAPSTDKERGFLSIEGTLLNDDDDKKVDAEERAKAKGKAKGRRIPSSQR